MTSRALARILKLPVIFETVPIQNDLKWSKMGYNCIKCPNWSFFAHQKRKLPVKMAGMMGPSFKALVASTIKFC